MDIQVLKDQLAKFESEFKRVEATLYRLDGAIQAVTHLIAEAEKPVEKKDKKDK